MGLFSNLFGGKSGGAGSNASALTERAFDLIEKRKFDKAISLLEQAVKIDPKCGEAYNELAFIYGRMRNDLSAADRFARMALSCEPANCKYYDAVNGFQVALARRYSSRERITEAMTERLQDIQAEIDKDPDYAPGYLMKASALALKGASKEEWMALVDKARSIYEATMKSGSGEPITQDRIDEIIAHCKSECDAMMVRWEKTV